jgi:hypothetical protein
VRAGYDPPVRTKELIEWACPRINQIGAAFYFTPETVAVGRTLGLDGFRYYFLGRGGVLGDVDWPVVLSAFGYFKPALVEKMWTTARNRHPARDAARTYMECCADFGRARLADTDGLGALCEAATAVNTAALEDPSGLTLWAGMTGLSLAEDLPARAMQLIAVLRELRGSVHLVAVVASGVPTPVAHRIRRPDDLAMFGWADGEIAVPTAADRSNLLAADALTDRLVGRAYGALDDDGAAALVHGLDGIEAALAGS